MPIEYTKKNLRGFAVVMAVAFGVLGGISFYKHGYALTDAALILWAIAAAWLLFGLALPSALKPFYFLWMKLAAALNFVMTRVILTIFYFMILFPTGLVIRIFRDPLDRKLSKEAKSYWIERKEQPQRDHFEKPY